MQSNEWKEKLSRMREGGQITGRVLHTLISSLAPGDTTEKIDGRAERMIRAASGTPSFPTVRGYQWATCITVNEEIVHGVPSARHLKAGAVVSIDVGTYFRGFHTDAAWTAVVPDRYGRVEMDSRMRRFLSTGKRALREAIACATVGKYIGDISATIQRIIEGRNYTVSREFTGHGIGVKLHEEPTIYGYGKPGTGVKIIPGMTLAIEVIYAMGDARAVFTRDDGWTVATKDGSPAALFEHTIAVTPKGPFILTPMGF